MTPPKLGPCAPPLQVPWSGGRRDVAGQHDAAGRRTPPAAQDVGVNERHGEGNVRSFVGSFLLVCTYAPWGVRADKQAKEIEPLN